MPIFWRWSQFIVKFRTLLRTWGADFVRTGSIHNFGNCLKRHTRIVQAAVWLPLSHSSSGRSTVTANGSAAVKDSEPACGKDDDEEDAAMVLCSPTSGAGCRDFLLANEKAFACCQVPW